MYVYVVTVAMAMVVMEGMVIAASVLACQPNIVAAEVPKKSWLQPV